MVAIQYIFFNLIYFILTISKDDLENKDSHVLIIMITLPQKMLWLCMNIIIIGALISRRCSKLLGGYSQEVAA